MNYLVIGIIYPCQAPQSLHRLCSITYFRAALAAIWPQAQEVTVASGTQATLPVAGYYAPTSSPEHPEWKFPFFSLCFFPSIQAVKADSYRKGFPASSLSRGRADGRPRAAAAAGQRPRQRRPSACSDTLLRPCVNDKCSAIVLLRAPSSYKAKALVPCVSPRKCSWNLRTSPGTPGSTS